MGAVRRPVFALSPVCPARAAGSTQLAMIPSPVEEMLIHRAPAAAGGSMRSIAIAPFASARIASACIRSACIGLFVRAPASRPAWACARPASPSIAQAVSLSFSAVMVRLLLATVYRRLWIMGAIKTGRSRMPSIVVQKHASGACSPSHNGCPLGGTLTRFARAWLGLRICNWRTNPNHARAKRVGVPHETR